MKHIRLSLVGFGVVGQGFAELIMTKHDFLKQHYGVDISLVGVANARHGFIYRQDGLHIPTVLQLIKEKASLATYPGAKHWDSVLEGLQTSSADILVEVTPTNLRDAEPGMSYIRTALMQGMHVVTANKGPAALAANELISMAHQHGVQLRMESTVMAGTPVISTIQEGMAGAQIVAMRGILNGTTNYILSAMVEGRDYADALADAQAKGYAETDPTADVEGYDAVAKSLILAALIFNHPLKPEQVVREGITAVTREQIQTVHNQNKRIKLIASLRKFSDGDGQKTSFEARVEPTVLSLTDPLAHVDGVTNALTIHT
ncbi:MAG TPA: homoserine dehydrogenase, partial [Ktedonobacteraceae bacterium]|nr:homoserine dehydrogenase [Ktedonobacteraceae bacterium]